jgi:deoxyribonuclease-1-like protein
MLKTLVWLPLSSAVALAAASCLSGCNAGQALPETAAKVANASPAVAAEPAAEAGQSAGETIKIASFNIQVFGTSKIGKPQVMDVLSKVVRRFDVVAIQEVRSKDDSIVPRFAQMVNAEGAKYDCVVGPRLGRTSSKEQYAFLFDTRRIELEQGSVYTVSDPQDLLHREPLVARFRVRGPPPAEAFCFTLVNIHTDPDEAAEEVDALADVFTAVQSGADAEGDVILLGDLNADEQHLGRLGRLPGVAWAIAGRKTNTRQTHGYDNLVFDRRATTEYTGYSGVLDLATEYNLTLPQALEVSDHLPVWAEFRARQGGAGAVLAGRPTPAAK